MTRTLTCRHMRLIDRIHSEHDDDPPRYRCLECGAVIEDPECPPILPLDQDSPTVRETSRLAKHSAYDQFDRLLRIQSARHQCFELLLIHAADRCFVCNLRLRVKNLDDRDCAGVSSALDDFHAIYVAASSFA